MYTEKLLLRKMDIAKTSVFQVWKIRLQVTFWGAPSHLDIIDF